MGTHKIYIGGRLMKESNMKNSCCVYFMGWNHVNLFLWDQYLCWFFNRVGNENAQQVRYYCSLLLDIASPFFLVASVSF